MSGTFWFGEKHYFSRAGWAWRTLVDYLREEQVNFPKLEDVLADLVTVETEHFNFEEATKSQLELIFAALQAISRRLSSQGPVGWRDPTFFAGFMTVLEEVMNAIQAEIQARNDGAP